MLLRHRLRLWTFAVCTAAAFLAGSGAAAGKPVALINSSVAEGTAPLSVMFDALDCEGEIAEYTWDLGDESPGNRRAEHGWLAAHRYEEPGRYTVTLTVRDESGEAAETSLVITAHEPDGKTYYFSDADGDDAHTPAQAQNPATPWKTMEKLDEEMTKAPAGTRFLLKRGDTFPSEGPHVGMMNTRPENPVVVGAYGEGPDPVIQAKRDHYALLITSSGGLVMQDLHFRGVEQTGRGIYGYSHGGAGIRHLTLRRLTLENFDIGLYFSHGKESKPNGYIIVEDCVLRGNRFTGWLAGQGSHFVVRNSELAHNGVHPTKHHNMYFQGDAFLIEDNYSHHGSGSAFNTHDTSHTVIRRNRIHTNGLEQGAGIGMAWNSAGNVVHHLLIEANDFYDNGLICWAQEDKDPEVPNDVTFRNNVFRQNRRPLTYAYMDGLHVVNNTFYRNRGPDISEGGNQRSADCVIANNIFYREPSESPVFQRFYRDRYGAPDAYARVDHITWAHNLVFVPGIGPDECTIGWLQAGDRKLAFDAWKALTGDTGAIYADPRFVDAAAGNFGLTPGSPALDAAAATCAPPYDHAGTPRPQGHAPDIGALEREAR